LKQLLDLRRPQGGDPIEPAGGHEFITNPRAGEHAAVTHQYDALERKALAQFGDDRTQRARIGGVALEHFDRHWAAVGIGQQAEGDLQFVALAVAAIAVAR
jgi:hypothetical protein